METCQPRRTRAGAIMLCCTSAPPTTRIVPSPASTGHAVGATKHTWGLPAGWERSDPSRGMSGHPCDGRGPDIALVDALELQRRLLDARVGARPALLLAH